MWRWFHLLGTLAPFIVIPWPLFYSPLSRFWELLIGSILAYIKLYDINNITLFKKRVSGFLRSSYLNMKHKSQENGLNSAYAGLVEGPPSPKVLSCEVSGGSITYTRTREDYGQIVKDVQSIVGFTLIGSGFIFITKQSSFPGMWALLPVFGAALIISAGTKSWINQYVLSHRVLVWFGLISYPCIFGTGRYCHFCASLKAKSLRYDTHRSCGALYCTCMGYI